MVNTRLAGRLRRNGWRNDYGCEFGPPFPTCCMKNENSKLVSIVWTPAGLYLNCQLNLIMRRATFISYIVILHVVLALVLWKSDFLSRVERKFGVNRTPPPTQEITEHYKRTLAYHVRMDGNVPDGSVVFIGDSLTQGLCTDAVTSPSVNYGIGSDTTVGVIERLPAYSSLRRASVVVLACGVNDMKFRDNKEIVQNYRRILQGLPQSVAIVCSAVLPVNEGLYGEPKVVNNAKILDLNFLLKGICSEDARCVFVDAGGRLVDAGGNLSPTLQDGDGIHLNSAGNRIWIDELRNAIGKALHRGT